ncbi:MAG: hypothetical protein JXR76_00290 [Deltaproteobacteria bacterium]|nr:hypothetical protein [Deltaproteobacteria bacterium]
MSKLQKNILFVLIGLSVALLVSKILAPYPFRYLMLLFEVILTGVAIGNTVMTRDKRTSLILAAFVCMTTGDAVINFTPYVKLQIVSFALCHILLSIYFCLEAPIRRSDLKRAIIILVISAVVYVLEMVPVWPSEYGLIFAGYIVLLSFMLWRAVSYRNREFNPRKTAILVAGAVCFYLTDVLVGVRILYGSDIVNIPIYIVYPPALLCMGIFNWYHSSIKCWKKNKQINNLNAEIQNSTSEQSLEIS